MATEKQTRSKTTSTRTTRNKKQQKKKSILKRFFLTVLTLFILTLIAGGALFFYYAKDAPQITEAELNSDSTTTLYDANGKVFKTLGLETRTHAKESEIPQQLKDAVISIEDRRFYKHIGVDPIRIVGAALSNVKGSSGLQGGSTLTQQLVKLSVFSNVTTADQTIKRKAQEAWLALKIEREYSKEQILTFYINKVYLSNGIYGMATGAKYYFNKSLKDLTLDQMALLAGMPQSPTQYDPYVNPNYAKQRRDLVLDAMVENKKITASQAAEAKKVAVSKSLVNHKNDKEQQTNSVFDAYLKEVLNEVKEKTDYDVYKDGLKIYTNIDMTAQKKLYDIVNSSSAVDYPDDLLQNAVTMVDVNTGQVKAMIGGRKQQNVQLGLNRAVQTSRSNGSTMKPIADYGPAIEYLNYSTAQPMVDAPYQYEGTNINLYNWDRTYMGDISLRTALAQSRNVPAVKTLMAVGIDKSKTFMKGLGIELKNMVASNGIGGEVSTLQMASAYAAFANGGTYYKPYYINKITTTSGKTITYTASGKKAMKESTAYMITDVLKDVISEGTGTEAQIAGLMQAGKTGTTDYSTKELKETNFPSGVVPDVWFSGYTRNYSIAVWTGYDKKFEPGGYLNAADQSISMEIYQAFMSAVAKGKSNKDWVKPDSVVKSVIIDGSDPIRLAGPYAYGNTSTELFVKGTQPTIQSAETNQTQEETPSSSSQVTLPESSSTSSSSASIEPESSASSVESQSSESSSSSTPAESTQPESKESDSTVENDEKNPAA